MGGGGGGEVVVLNFSFNLSKIVVIGKGIGWIPGKLVRLLFTLCYSAEASARRARSAKPSCVTRAPRLPRTCLRSPEKRKKKNHSCFAGLSLKSNNGRTRRDLSLT